MPNIFLIADTHFGHEAMYSFLRSDGSKIRPHGTSAVGDEEMIEKWNKAVRPSDKVYHLGDVAIRRQHISTMARLNGEKILIRGNHDIFKINDYLPYFKDIRGTHKLDKLLLSHYPVHESSIPPYAVANVHGHIHYQRVMKDGEVDARYKCVCVEQTDYTPIDLSSLYDQVKTL